MEQRSGVVDGHPQFAFVGLTEIGNCTEVRSHVEEKGILRGSCEADSCSFHPSAEMAILPSCQEYGIPTDTSRLYASFAAASVLPASIFTVHSHLERLCTEQYLCFILQCICVSSLSHENRACAPKT